MDVTDPSSAEEVIRTVLEEVQALEYEFYIDTDVATDNLVAALRRYGYLPEEEEQQ